jgi:hypothetical protein
MTRIFYKLFFGNPEYNVLPRHTAYGNYSRHLNEIWNNEKHNDVGLEKILRLYLVAIQIIFPGLHIRNYFGKKGVITRNVANEFYVLFKTALPLFFLFSGLYKYTWVVGISVYLMLETAFYVAALIFVSDIFVKPRSYRRNILMLFLNFLEITLSFSVIYGGLGLLGSKVTNVYDFIYFSIITSTAIGFGDVYPVNDTGKIIVCIHALMTVSFIVLFLNFFTSKVEIMHTVD